MSVTDSQRPGLKRDSGGGKNPSPKPIFRRPLVLGGAIIAVALIAGGALWASQRSGPPTVTLPRAAPITLPGTLGGLTAMPANTDYANQPIWRDHARAAAPGAVVVGRSYGSAQVRRQIRVVAGRADLAGKLEFTWAADDGRKVESSLGPARCTQNLILAAGSKPSVRPTMLLCWRTTPTLSAYSAVIDFDHRPTDAVGLAALDTTWRAALTGR